MLIYIFGFYTQYCMCYVQVYGRNYYRPDQYVSKSVMEKRALPYIQEELLRLHTNNAQMLTDESEQEFLKVPKQSHLEAKINMRSWRPYCTYITATFSIMRSTTTLCLLL